jgi:AAA15 family ATPase/GTPase
MIVEFNVKNFGSIKDKQTLSFEADSSTHLSNQYFLEGTSDDVKLLKLALIYGANASGKTTLLSALDFFRDLVLYPIGKRTEELNFYPFLFDPNTAKQNSFMSLEFIQNKVRYLYEIEFSEQAIVKEELTFYNPNKAKVFKRTTDLDKQLTKIAFGSKIRTDKTFEKTLESNTLWNNTVLGGYLKTNIELRELREVLDWFRKYLRPIVDTKVNLESFVIDNLEDSQFDKEDIISILKQADFNISGIAYDEIEPMTEDLEKLMRAMNVTEERLAKMKSKPPRKVILEHTVNGESYKLPIHLESEGTKRYFGFAGLLALLIKKPSAVQIDELELSLHPDLYLHFLLTFLMNSKHSQLIATTHNREILSNRDVFRADAIWFTNKSENAGTELYSLADFDSSVIRDSTNVLNAYKTGKLRATPNLGDYYIDLK